MSEGKLVTARPVGTIVGVFAGGVTILLMERLGHLLFGTADPADLSTITTPMYLSVLAAWIAGAAVGSAVATVWSRPPTKVPGAVVGLVLLAGAAANMFAFPHPLWVMVGSVVLMPLVALGTAHLVHDRSTAA